MGIRLINYVNNQLQSPALYTDAFAKRPAYGIYGRLFMSSDTKEIYQDLATSWSLLADAGAGSGTLQSVTTNGSSTTTGITILSNNLALTNATSNFYIKALTIGSILFSGDSSGLVTQDNANFFWDNTNKRLGIGTAAPSSKLDIHSTGINATFNGTSTNNAYLVFQSAGTSKWYAGNLVAGAVANDFVIYDYLNSAYRLYVHNTGVINIPTSLIIGTATPTSIYAFDVTGTSRFTAAITGLSATFSSSVTSTNLILTAGTLFGAGNTGFSNRLSDTTLYLQMPLSGFNITDSALNTKFILSSTGAATFYSSVQNTGLLKSINTYVSDTTVYQKFNDNTGYDLNFGGTASGFKWLQVQDASGSASYTSLLLNPLGGNVGIGTAAPSYKLQLSTDSAAKPTTALWTIASDERIKENINTYKKGLQELLKINPITYDYNGLGGFIKGKGGVGIIAQQIIDILPDSVSSIKAKLNETDEEETDILNFNGHELIYVLINSIQELNEKLVRNNIN